MPVESGMSQREYGRSPGLVCLLLANAYICGY